MCTIYVCIYIYIEKEELLSRPAAVKLKCCTFTRCKVDGDIVEWCYDKSHTAILSKTSFGHLVFFSFSYKMLLIIYSFFSSVTVSHAVLCEWPRSKVT